MHDTQTPDMPPTPEMPVAGVLADDDPRLAVARAVWTGGTIIAGIRPDQLSSPTPCPEYDVRRLLGHLVGVLHRMAAVGRGEHAFTVPEAIDGIDDDGWAAAWTGAAHEVQAVWSDDALLTSDVSLPWAELPGADVLRMYTNEITVHSWDLAVATGQRPAWDEPTVAVALDAIRQQLPAGGRRARFEQMLAEMQSDGVRLTIPFDEAIDPGADASPIDRLVAWNGRDPAWSPA